MDYFDHSYVCVQDKTPRNRTNDVKLLTLKCALISHLRMSLLIHRLTYYTQVCRLRLINQSLLVDVGGLF